MDARRVGLRHRPRTHGRRNRRWLHGCSPHVRRPMAAISASGMSIWKRWCCSYTPPIRHTVTSKGKGHRETRPQPSLRDCSRSCNSSATCCRLGRRPVWRSGSGNSHTNRVVHSMECLPHDSVLPFAQQRLTLDYTRCSTLALPSTLFLKVVHSMECFVSKSSDERC